MSPIPKEIQEEYSKLCLAQERFEHSLLKYAPEPPFKKGDKVTFNRSTNKIGYGIISMISYDPYNHEKYGGWYIVINPTKKEWIKSDNYRNHLHPSDYSNLKKHEPKHRMVGERNLKIT